MNIIRITLLVIVTLFSNSYVNADDRNSFVGVGIGGGYSLIGFRIDKKIAESLLLSGSLGGGGINVGIRYNRCLKTHDMCINGTLFYGENMRGIGDTVILSTSASVGIGFEHYFTKLWSLEMEVYYQKYLEFTGPGYDNDDRLWPSLGFKRSFK